MGKGSLKCLYKIIQNQKIVACFVEYHGSYKECYITSLDDIKQDWVNSVDDFVNFKIKQKNNEYIFYWDEAIPSLELPKLVVDWGCLDLGHVSSDYARAYASTLYGGHIFLLNDKTTRFFNKEVVFEEAKKKLSKELYNKILTKNNEVNVLNEDYIFKVIRDKIQGKQQSYYYVHAPVLYSNYVGLDQLKKLNNKKIYLENKKVELSNKIDLDEDSYKYCTVCGSKIRIKYLSVYKRNNFICPVCTKKGLMANNIEVELSKIQEDIDTLNREINLVKSDLDNTKIMQQSSWLICVMRLKFEWL